MATQRRLILRIRKRHLKFFVHIVRNEVLDNLTLTNQIDDKEKQRTYYLISLCEWMAEQGVEALAEGETFAKGHKDVCGDTLSPMSLRDATLKKKSVFDSRKENDNENTIIYQIVDVAVSVKNKLKLMYQMGRKSRPCFFNWKTKWQNIKTSALRIDHWRTKVASE